MKKKYKVGITFGAFDPLHYGHIKIFERAKEQCEKLVVCVSTQDYIALHKGREERVKIGERMNAVKAISYVDEVGWQDPVQDKADCIKRYKAEVIFVGDDWNKKTFRGEGLGVPVVYLPHTPGMNSTQLVNDKNIKHTVC